MLSIQVQIQRLHRQGVTADTEPGHHANDVRRHETLMPYRFRPGPDIGKMHFHGRNLYPGQAIGNGEAGMGVSSGVKGNPSHTVAFCLLQTVDQFSFAIFLDDG